MKEFNFAFILIVSFFSANVSSESLESSSLPDKGLQARAYLKETNPDLKKSISEKLMRECPFRKSNSELDLVTNEAINLQLVANTPDSKLNQCATQLQNFNDTINKTAELKTKLDLAQSHSGSLSPEQEAELKKEIETTQVAANSFNNLLKMGCELKNGTNDISRIGYSLISVLDISAAVLSVNPANTLIATSAALSGRLVVSLSKWLFEHPNNNQILTKEASDSRRFINDLCLFRTLAYKYDDLYIDPFEDPTAELLNRQEVKNKASARVQELKQCVTPVPNEALTSLTTFSKELLNLSEGSVSQKQCLNLIKKFKDVSPNGKNNLRDLAISFNCPSPSPDQGINATAFCNNYQAIEKLTAGDIYESCEDDHFQKKLVAKFTNITDIIFQSIQEKSKENTFKVSEDDLMKLKAAENDERIAIQKYASLQGLLEESPLTQANSSKSMISLGRTILGDRFDNFSKQTLKSMNKNMDEAEGNLSPILRKMKKLEKISNPFEKAKTQNELCTSSKLARQQLGVAYNSGIGLSDVCFFMKGAGTPPLKSKNLNFDNYSTENKKRFGLFTTEAYLSGRCEKAEKQIQKNITTIREMVSKLNTLGCQ
jgi:hypothetical protein